MTGSFPANAPAQQPRRMTPRHRYGIYYYALAGFNLLTVLVSIGLIHGTLDVYEESLNQTSQWSIRRDQFMELSNCALAINAPGNDIFESRNAEWEAQRLSEAWLHYQNLMKDVRDEAAQNVLPEFAGELTSRFDKIDTAALTMREEAAGTLRQFSRGSEAEAARKMATMDQSLARALKEISSLNHDARKIHNAGLGMEKSRLQKLKSWKWAILGAIVVIVVGVTIYGRKMLVKMSASEAALASSEARLRGVLDNAADAIVMIGETGIIESFNPAAEIMFGYSGEEILGTNISRLMPAPYAGEHDAYLARYRQTGEKRIIGIGREAVGLRKDGSEFPVELAISESYLDGRRSFTGIVRDSTARKEVERTLRKAQAELQAVFDSSPVGMCLGNAQGKCLLVNGKFETISGFKAEDMFGERWVGSLHPEDKERVVDAWYNAIAWDQPFENEHRLIKPDGTVVWTNVKVATIRSGESMIGYVGTLEDVTARRQAELDLWRNNVELQAAQGRLEEQTSQLEQQAKTLLEAQERAEQANRSKSEFLANMSHEIRTPMTAILGYTDTLIEESRGRKNSLDYLQVIKRNGDHLLEIINDILDLSKIEAGKLQVELIPCSPLAIIADVHSLMKVRSDAKGLELLCEFRGPIPDVIQCDPTRLRQILINLIGNAIKFTEQGSVTLLTQLLGSARGGMMLQFEIIDTGVGMTPEQVSRLFQPFQQADNSTTRKFGGTGLGLSISLRLARSLGGEIAVSSVVGNGSVFALRIATGSLEGVRMTENPSTAAPLQPATAASTDPQRVVSPLVGYQILLAEDGVDNQRLISYVLKKAGAAVTVAENGKIALQLATEAWQANQPFDVILMDMQMPVLDGYGAVRQLRAEEYTGPIIALTAHAMQSDRQKCIEAGCDDHSPKPIDRQKLISLIASYPANLLKTAPDEVAAAPV